MLAVPHQAWQSMMVVSSSLHHVRCRCGQINSQEPSSWPTTQDNPGKALFVATCSHVVKEFVTGHSTRPHYIPLLGDQVEVLEKHSKLHVKVPHYQLLQ